MCMGGYLLELRQLINCYGTKEMTWQSLWPPSRFKEHHREKARKKKKKKTTGEGMWTGKAEGCPLDMPGGMNSWERLFLTTSSKSLCGSSHAWHMYAWKPEDNLWEIVLPTHTGMSGIRFSIDRVFQSYFAGPSHLTFVFCTCVFCI